MSKVIETTVYQLAELSYAARENARAWYREGGFEYEWYDATFEDFERICEILGVRLKTRPVRLMGGSSRQEPHIWFRGFWSQGDGACFEGRYEYAKSASAAIRAYAPRDAELHRIADTLQAAQRRNFYQLYADIDHRGRSYHMEIVVKRASSVWQDMTRDAEDALDQAMRDLAHWLYRQLECKYEYLTSDEAVDEAIVANEYTFTESGRRFD